MANNAGLGATGASAGTTVSDGATLAVTSGVNTSEALTLTGTVVGSGGALRNVSGNNTTDGAVTLTGATRINSDAGQLSMGGGITGAFDLTFGGAGNLLVDLAGVDTGAGNVIKDGGGVLAFSGSNSYTGTTTVNAGIVQANSGTAFSDTANLIVNAPGNVQITASETVGGLSGNGTIFLDLTGTVLTTALSTGTVTYSGVISEANLGQGSLVKTGAGTQELSGANTYTGATTVSGGVLSVTGSLSSQTVNVTSGSLRVNGAAISDTATVTLSGTGNLALTGSERIGALAGSANTTVTLGGNTLTLAAQTAALAGVTFQGSSGTDRLAITLVAAAGSFTLTGVTFANWTEGTDTVTVTGNAQANLLTGYAGNNVLNGGLGNDTMIGGAGNDTYVVNAAGDRVFETTTTASLINAGGIDTVQSAVTFNLDSSAGVRFVERLTLTGTGNINGTGNALANLLTGNAGNNVLNGGLGNDTMIGGAGSDMFVFNTALAATNVDRLSDFSVVDDTIRLDDGVFAGLTTGSLAASAFATNLTGDAADELDRIIHETDTGRLYFDADGSGSGVRVQFATLTANLTLTNADFFVF